MKKSAKGTLKVTVTGSGTYTITGKKTKKKATASKSFKLAPGAYRVAAPGGTVSPAKVQVRKGKTAKVKVTFPTSPALVPLAPPTPAPPLAPGVQRASTDATGVQGNMGSEWPAWSPDGTKVAFVSNATNLVPGDTNQQLDAFVKTLATGAIQRISTDAAGGQGNGASYDLAWSPDGTKIAFTSGATNLVPGDVNKLPDVFVKTLATGAIESVSNSPFELWISTSQTQSPSLGGTRGSTHPAWSPDGLRIAFDSDTTNLVQGDTNGRADVFVKTLGSSAINSIQRISTDAAGVQGDAASYDPSWSPDGTKVAFDSFASNLVSGDTNGRYDVFVKTLAGGAIQRVSTDAAGNQAIGGPDAGSYGPQWSPDGTRIVFTSDMTNLVPGDTNGVEDVFVKTLGGAIQRVSTDGSGNQAAGPSISGNPKWSPDGAKIVFSSSATNLVPGDTNGIQDVFVKTLAGGAIQRVSTDAAGGQSNGGHRGSEAPVWSPDGTRIAFFSDATNLVSGDTNGVYDVFVKRLS